MNLRSKLGKSAHNKWCISTFCFVTVFALIYIFYYLYSFAPFGGMTLALNDGDLQYVDFFLYLKDVLAGKTAFTTLCRTRSAEIRWVFSAIIWLRPLICL